MEIDSSNDISTAIPKRTKLPFFTPVPWDWRLIIQLILAVTGIIGNSLVIHVYLHTKALKKKTTNTFIVALAAADLITSICIIPFPMLSYVPENGLGDLYCRIVFSANIMWISIVASILTLTILAVERYVAVAYPIRYKRIFTSKNTRLIIFMIWILGIVINTFEYYGFFAIGGTCWYILPSARFQKFLGVGVFLIEYLIPFLIMIVASYRTIQILNTNSANFKGKSDEQSRSAMSLLRARRRLVNMLLVVIITFIICWSPDQFAYLVFNLGFVEVKYLFGPIYRAFVALAFANSCINPFIYVLTNNNFRKALMITFGFGKRRVHPSTDEETGRTCGETEGESLP